MDNRANISKINYQPTTKWRNNGFFFLFLTASSSCKTDKKRMGSTFLNLSAWVSLNEILKVFWLDAKVKQTAVLREFGQKPAKSLKKVVNNGKKIWKEAVNLKNKIIIFRKGCVMNHDIRFQKETRDLAANYCITIITEGVFCYLNKHKRLEKV